MADQYPPSQQRAQFQLDFDVNPVTMARLDKYVQLLQAWQRAKNLVSATTLTNIWSRHITDSFQLIRLRSDHSQTSLTTARWMDLGSGAGLPGMVLALALSDGSSKNVTLVEANGRKCSFLRAVSRETNCPVSIHNTRIETVPDQPGFTPPDLITARALAALPDLCRLMYPLMSSDTVALVHKGQDFAAEIENTAKYWDFSVVKHISRVAESSVILEISGLKPRALP